MRGKEGWAGSVESRWGRHARDGSVSQAISRAAKFSQDFGVSRLLHCSTTRNQIDYQNDQREQQQQVNESTHRVT